jgi:hypothetical protein
MSQVRVVPATPSDLPAVAAIYADSVAKLDSTASGDHFPLTDPDVDTLG